MAKLTRFPLEMANGAKVRSIEELRENADVKSIVAYFLDGRLGRWCSAWRYDDLPAQLENVTTELIKHIYDALEIPVDASEIENYVKENGIHASGKPAMNIVDDEELKNKLKPYINPEVNLSDYAIELLPVNSTLTVISVSYKNNSIRFNDVYDAQMQEDDNGLYKYIAYLLCRLHNIHNPPKLATQGKYFNNETMNLNTPFGTNKN